VEFDWANGIFVQIPIVVKEIGIMQTITHEKFNLDKHNDIALLKLAREVKYTKFIKPICLPLKHQSFNTDNLNFITTGFGNTESGLQSQVKLKTDVSGITNNECKKTFQKIAIIESQLCALGVNGKDSW
jgi:hypothetical protein